VLCETIYRKENERWNLSRRYVVNRRKAAERLVWAVDVLAVKPTVAGQTKFWKDDQVRILVLCFRHDLLRPADVPDNIAEDAVDLS
jgi:hypothetical protein